MKAQQSGICHPCQQLRDHAQPSPLARTAVTTTCAIASIPAGMSARLAGIHLSRTVPSGNMAGIWEGEMIRNDDRIGNYWVTVYATKKRVAQFQCPTLADASTEANRIASERKRLSLPTARAIATRLKGKSGRVRLFDDPIEIQFSTNGV